MAPRKIATETSPGISLRYYYLIAVVAITLGILLVLLLNLFTPLQIIEHSILKGVPADTDRHLFTLVFPRLAVLLILSYTFILLGVRKLLAPIALCLNLEEQRQKPPKKQLESARKRLLKLPSLFVLLNVILWIILPLLVATPAVVTDSIELGSALVFSARASLIGLISSSMAALRIKIFSRKTLIPYFFPQGVLTTQEVENGKSIGRQLLQINKLVALIPLCVLIITLLTVQWELGHVTISAKEFTNELLVFTLILSGWTVLFSTILSQLQGRIFVEPLEEVIQRLKNIEKGDYSARIAITSGDEIGYVGATVNTMCDGLEERLALQQSLQLASLVQQSLMPAEHPTFSGFDIAGTSIYCDETGGDYYDYIEFDDPGNHKLGVVVGDVSGHGIASALFMATARGFLRQRAALPGSMSEIISDVNRQLCHDTDKTGNFMTMYALMLDNREQSLEWIRAGHDPALLYEPNSQAVTELKGKGIALGVSADYSFQNNEKVSLKDGQILLIATDGLYEARNSSNEMFGKERVKNILANNGEKYSEEILGILTDELTTFRGDIPAEDDFTCVVIKVGAENT